MAVPFTQRATEAIYLHSKEITDLISKNVATVGVFGARGRIEIIEGGLGWRERVFYGTNPNSGHGDRYTPFGVDRLENMTMAQYDKAFFKTSLVVNKVDVAEAKGEAAQGNLVKDSWEIVKADAVSNIGAALLASTKVNDNLPIPLPVFLPATAAASQTGTDRGGINSAQNSWWRSYAYTTAVSDIGAVSSAGLGILQTAQLAVSRSSAFKSMPDFGVTTAALYAKCTTNAEALRRFTTDDKTAAMGFANFKYGPTTVVWDTNCPAKAFYLINTNTMKIKVLRMPNMQNIEAKGSQLGLPMVIEPMRDDIDTVNFVSLVYLPYALTCSDLASNGVLSNCTE